MKKPQNYYLEVITPTQAKIFWKDGFTAIFKLYNDDSEALIETEHELHDAIDLGIEIGIEHKI